MSSIAELISPTGYIYEKITLATAFLGFDSSNEGRFALQRSCVGDRIKVEVETNLNGPYQSGLWVYRVDTEIDEPGSLCPALTVPSYGYCRTNDYRVGYACFNIIAPCDTL